MIVVHGLPPITAGIGVWLDGVGSRMSKDRRLLFSTGDPTDRTHHQRVRVLDGVRHRWERLLRRGASWWRRGAYRVIT